MWPLGTAFFTQHNVFKAYPCCSSVGTIRPFIAEQYSIVCMQHVVFTHHQLMGIWVVSPCWLLAMLPLCTPCTRFCVAINVPHLHLDVIFGSRVARSCPNSMFNIWRNCQTAFQSSCTIFQSSPECRRVPSSPHPQHSLSA